MYIDYDLQVAEHPVFFILAQHHQELLLNPYVYEEFNSYRLQNYKVMTP